MKTVIQSILIILVFLYCYSGTSFATNLNVKSYGHFKKMVQMAMPLGQFNRAWGK